MNNAKKMILIDPEVIEKIKNDNSNTNTTNNLSRLDEEMHKVLNTKIDDRDKWSLYLQTLQRYLYFVGKDRKPIEIPILSLDEVKVTDKENNQIESAEIKQSCSEADDSSVPLNDYYSKLQLIQLLPKTYKIKGELLLDILLKNKEKIYWNKQGTVFIKNKEIFRSNIVDLLNDVIRPLRNTSPHGWSEFAIALKELQVPLSYIGNPRRVTFINVLNKTPDFGKRFNSNLEQEYETPQSFKTEQKVKKKLDWEKWTPY